MGSSTFTFKQFEILQDACAMKVGTDGVLLGAWADINQAQHILDIGTGTGLVALMLAQRSNATITAIDIDEQACLQASQNVKNSAWHDRVFVQHTSLENFISTTSTMYDLIVSNPPYFINSMHAPNAQRTVARHATDEFHQQIIKAASVFLKPNAKLCVVLPFNLVEPFTLAGALYNLFCTHQIDVKTTPTKAPKRALLQFSKSQSAVIASELVIENARHEYSTEFKRLLHDFYLKL